EVGDLFDEFMKELRRRQAEAAGRRPGRPDDRDRDSGADEPAGEADEEPVEPGDADNGEADRTFRPASRPRLVEDDEPPRLRPLGRGPAVEGAGRGTRGAAGASPASPSTSVRSSCPTPFRSGAS